MRPVAALLGVLVLFPPLREAQAKPLWLCNVHTHEELRLEGLGPSRLNSRSWRTANHFFRSWRTHNRRTMHLRLIRTLAHIQTHFGGRRIELVSGYRQPAADEEPSSYHQVGRAADIRIPGVPKRELFEVCRTLPRVGCGFYPNAEFVHVDVRGASGLWVDLSAPGEPRRYVGHPAQWLVKRQ